MSNEELKKEIIERERETDGRWGCRGRRAGRAAPGRASEFASSLQNLTQRTTGSWGGSEAPTGWDWVTCREDRCGYRVQGWTKGDGLLEEEQLCCRDQQSASERAECCWLSEGEPCLWGSLTTASSWPYVGFGEVWSSGVGGLWPWTQVPTGRTQTHGHCWKLPLTQVGRMEKMALVVACYDGQGTLPFSLVRALSLSLF